MLDQVVTKAQHLVAIGRYDEAVALLTNSEETAASDQALVVLSKAYRLSGQLDEALNAAFAAAGLEPESASAFLHQVQALCDLERPHEAVAPVSRALALAPTVVVVHYLAADVHRRIGAMDTAMAHAHTCLELDPESELGWDAIARVQLIRGEWANVVMTTQRMLELKPESLDAKYLLGIAQANMGGTQKKQAFETLISVLRVDPTQQNIRTLLNDLAKPKFHVPGWAIALLFVTGVLGVLIPVWAVVVLSRWLQLPKDVRALVWADRWARIRIALSLCMAILIIIGTIAVFVLVLVDFLQDPRTLSSGLSLTRVPFELAFS